MSKLLAALILVAILAPGAQAQPGSRVSLGAGAGWTNYSNGAFTDKGPSLVPEYHFQLKPSSERTNGLKWGVKGGLGYSTPDRHDMIGGFDTKTGNLRMIPVMVGGGPSYQMGPMRLGAGVVAGASFNHFTVDDAARTGYRDRLGSTLNSINAKNSVAVRPDVSLWYNFTPSVGLHSSVSYTYNRPTVETTVNGVTTSERWNADHLGYQVGLAYGIF
ncbi:MAG TPA: outer membrane beta-barrel protein [Candidatus Udaeobacter sp.]|jgi:hypothetical protein|nr:outer membrane beta-barrel protein [Candidatus Udaeobacter sp.]